MSGQHPSRLALDRVALGVADETTHAHAKGCAQCAAHLEALKELTGAPDFVHPSRLALDRLALGVADPETRAHAASCAHCTTHLKSVEVELPVPAWVRELEGAPRRAPFAWWKPAAGLMTMAAAVFVAVLAVPRALYVGDKGVGTPQAQVWVNRGGAVALWDGQPLRPDDAFRFEVRPGAYRHLTVVELQAGKLFRVLHSAPVSGDGLSPAWAVDAQGEQEEVVVLMSSAPLSENELLRALAGEGGVWSSRWKFPKEVKR